MGTESGKLNTTGAFNTYFGDLAGVLGTTASANALFGFRAGETIDTGFGNSFFGTQVGRANTNGSDNTFVGSFVDFASANDTGSGNTVIGAGARVAGNVSNATAIGSRAFASRAGVVVLGGINGVNGANQDSSVGIGTTNPQEKLDVIGGNIFIGSNGRGLILRSPSGNVCRRLSIDDNGALLTVAVACPAVAVQ